MAADKVRAGRTKYCVPSVLHSEGTEGSYLPLAVFSRFLVPKVLSRGGPTCLFLPPCPLYVDLK